MFKRSLNLKKKRPLAKSLSTHHYKTPLVQVGSRSSGPYQGPEQLKEHELSSRAGMGNGIKRP